MSIVQPTARPVQSTPPDSAVSDHGTLPTAEPDQQARYQKHVDRFNAFTRDDMPNRQLGLISRATAEAIARDSLVGHMP